MKYFAKMAIRFVAYAAIIGIVVAISIPAYLNSRHYYIYTDESWDNVTPYKILDTDSPYNIVLDQHSHTKHSDGGMTPRQNVLWHIAMGHNAMFLTDHNTMDNLDEVVALQQEFKDTILIMPGMEWTTSRIHLNFLGIYEWDFELFPIKSKPTDAEIAAAIAEAHNKGGIVTLNHYLWSTNKDKPTRQQFLDWGIDYIEVINNDCYPKDYYDIESIAFCQENGLGQITGTDMHYPNLMHMDNSIVGWTLLSVSEFSEDALMAELRARNTMIKHSTVGTPSVGEYLVKPGYKSLKPLFDVGKYFRSIYIGAGTVNFEAIGITALYFFVLYIIIEVFVLGYTLITKKPFHKRK